MKKYMIPKVVIKALNNRDIVTLSGRGENELPLQPVGENSKNGLESL